MNFQSNLLGSRRREMSRSRWTAMLAVALMALSFVVAACGGDDDAANDKAQANDTAKGGSAPAKDLKGQTVRLWIMNNGPSRVADTERIVKPFEQETGIKVKVELVGWD